MSNNIDPTTVDVDSVIQRIQAIRRGELPESDVSIEELRAAVEAQRRRFATNTGPADTPVEKKKISTKNKIVIPDLGGL